METRFYKFTVGHVVVVLFFVAAVLLMMPAVSHGQELPPGDEIPDSGPEVPSGQGGDTGGNGGNNGNLPPGGGSSGPSKCFSGPGEGDANFRTNFTFKCGFQAVLQVLQPQANVGRQFDSFADFFLTVFRAVITLVAVVAVGALIWGGIYYIISLGNDEKMQQAKRIILYAIIGLLIIGVSGLVVNVIVNLFVQPPGPAEGVAGDKDANNLCAGNEECASGLCEADQAGNKVCIGLGRGVACIIDAACMSGNCTMANALEGRACSGVLVGDTCQKNEQCISDNCTLARICGN
jgi:hypothetical protein